jgi:hypothetical protein
VDAICLDQDPPADGFNIQYSIVAHNLEVVRSVTKFLSETNARYIYKQQAYYLKKKTFCFFNFSTTTGVGLEKLKPVLDFSIHLAEQHQSHENGNN